MRTSITPIVMGCVSILVLACGGGGDADGPDASPTPFLRPETVQDLTQARVVEVLDGVSIEADIDGRVFRVRYLGVKVPADDLIDDGVPSVGEEALAFNRFLVEGRSVELERGAAESDQTGALLRYVYVDGEMVNVSLLANGYAIVADFPQAFEYQTEFLAAEESAKTSLRGLWNPSATAGEQRSAPAHGTPTNVPPFFGGTLPRPPGASQVCDFSGTTQPVIKGNIDIRTAERVYHVPGGLFYATTEVYEAQGDRWFCTEAEAVEADWRRSKR